MLKSDEAPRVFKDHFLTTTKGIGLAIKASPQLVLATDTHAKELRVFALGRKFLDRYKSLAESFYKEDSGLSKRRTLWVTLLSLLSSFAFYSCYLIVAIAAATGKMTLGNLTLYVVVFRQGQQAFQSCLSAIGKHLSLVFQDFNKYQLTVQENIGVGDAKFLDDAVHIRSAVNRAGAQDLVSELPEGLQTSLGTWFKSGVEISGGQWQKIALSRAFMRDEADILILDEPTAALDPEAEALAFEKFHELTIGKTSLIISHRFPLARLADHIIVLEHGMIQEQGSHDQLIKNPGRYAQLFKLQAQGYS